MNNYNQTLFDPPAPVAYVTLRHPNSKQAWSNVPMLLDTGADVSLVPQEVIQKLGLSIDESLAYELLGFDGKSSMAKAVELHLLFSHRIFRGKYILVNQEIGILGRDILNLIPLLFDGPNLTWSENH